MAPPPRLFIIISITGWILDFIPVLGLVIYCVILSCWIVLWLVIFVFGAKIVWEKEKRSLPVVGDVVHSFFD